jgi:hypothetical protein
VCNINKIHPWHLGEKVGDGQMDGHANMGKYKDLPVDKEAVQSFYHRPQNCTFLPLYKLVTKDNQPCGFLTKNTKQIHEEYCRETGDKIGRTKFREWRPKECNCITKTIIEQCM